MLKPWYDDQRETQCVLYTNRREVSLLENVPLSLLREMWFQQNGCPAHYSCSVREFIEYPGRWIGWSGTIVAS